jgi:Domain of unknown function (DUF1906)
VPSSARLCALCGLTLFIPHILSAQYLGFDRNDYPGDANLPVLRQTFAYIGYWLGNPPGENSNSWAGKRSVVQNAGFGFLVLFNGRLDAQLRRNAAALGRSDGQAAIAAAKREGFPAHTIIFLDLEEGGRMSPNQKGYFYAWMDVVNASGFRAGVYCSGIAVREDANTSVNTADDIRDNAHGRDITFWVVQDSCPPSPGCAFPKSPPSASASGVNYADIWQFVRSSKEAEFAAKCGGYNAQDNNCYPPGTNPSTHLPIDVNTATSADPSHGRL